MVEMRKQKNSMNAQPIVSFWIFAIVSAVTHTARISVTAYTQQIQHKGHNHNHQQLHHHYHPHHHHLKVNPDHKIKFGFSLFAVPGADIEQPPIDEDVAAIGEKVGAAAGTMVADAGGAQISSKTRTDILQGPSTATAAISSAATAAIGPPGSRGKVNEIDFCIAPADVSLSRAYGISATIATATSVEDSTPSSRSSTTTLPPSTSSPTLSLTRALNNASNRAVRRILLARSWPSAEALNLSLRRVAKAEQEREALRLAGLVASSSSSPTSSSSSSSPSLSSSSSSPSPSSDTASAVEAAKCPVPRPILNVLMRKQQEQQQKSDDRDDAVGETKEQQPQQTPVPRGRTDEEYVADQMRAFRERYGSLPGYSCAEDYLDVILRLATAGVESPRIDAVIKDGVYDESYKRVQSVLRSGGVVFEADPTTGTNRIASKLIDQDICLSVIDKLQLKSGKNITTFTAQSTSTVIEANGDASASATNSISDIGSSDTESSDIGSNDIGSIDSTSDNSDSSSSDISSKSNIIGSDISDSERKIIKETEKEETSAKEYVNPLKKLFLRYWRNKQIGEKPVTEDLSIEVDVKGREEEAEEEEQEEEEEEEEIEITNEDLGGVLLSSTEPSMTRQLNVLSNIVQRALLFGGNEELLVLAETLDADRAAFIERWYPGTGGPLKPDQPIESEPRPGVQFFNCLVQLLQDCYEKGNIVDLDSPLPLTQSYANSYERLVASAVELGSGYIKPVAGAALPKPRSAKEELGRFAVWESNFRASTKTDVSAYPEDMVGKWEVRDEIGGETIGTSSVILNPQGEVTVDPPLEGLRWRLDPGPTHLDTCTFQVLSSDGTILQYRGFIDRGARLEARFSKRSTRVRGSVMFQMRDGSIGYYRDILPINYRTGTTKFVMTKLNEETVES